MLTAQCLTADAVIRLHDQHSEGLSRGLIIDMITTAGGGKISRSQAVNIWDKTMLPLGKKLGLLTGYVKPQAGTSKRTAAGKPKLQKQWYDTVTEMIAKVREHAQKVLKDKKLVDKMVTHLIFNLDEECLHALGKNRKIVGAKGKKKHDNQNASSRFCFVVFGVYVCL